MSQLDDLYSALKNADAAGDTAGATKLATYIKSMSPEAAPAPAATPDTYGARLKQQTAAIGDELKNATLGAVRGAGSIGSTLLAVAEQPSNLMTGKGLSLEADRTRRQDMTDATQALGADPNSMPYKTGKLAGEVAGTAGAGGILANGARGLGAAPEIVNALRTSGFATGPSRLTAAGNLATRSVGGALAGGAQVGLADPEHAGTGAAIGAALPGALKLIGAAGSTIGNALFGSAAPGVKTAAVNAARDAGYVLPPTEMNPSVVNSTLEGLSGKIKTSQAASMKNQPVTNSLAAKALGIDPSQPITPQVLDSVRKTAGQAYEALKGTGTVTADEGFGKALDSIVSKYKGAAANFPGLVKSEVPEMIDALRQKTFSASGAVDAIGFLRDTAKEAFAKQNSGLGKAAKSAADELESLMGRHLEATGADPALIKAFQDARATIAKSYSVGKALNQTTGDVSAASLAAQKARGRPLSNELDTIAQAGQAFPKAMQSLPQNYNALSPLDFAAAAISGNPGHLAIPLIRPGIRAALLSETGQNLAAKGAPRINALAGPAIYRALPRAGQQN